MSSDVVTIFIVLILTDEQQQVWVESVSKLVIFLQVLFTDTWSSGPKI